MAVKTVRKLAAITATLHDGKNMIVLNEGRYATVSVESLAFLREKDAIDETGEVGLDRDGDGAAGGSRENEPPALTGRNKADLLEIAANEGVVVPEGATNKEIVALIESVRSGELVAVKATGEAGDETGDDANEGDAAGEANENAAP